MTTYTATYSAEDNKLRLYPSSRLDSEMYKRVSGLGFKWAPKQELFVAPAWNPEREDLCIELAGEIDAEETTLAERAVMKAERLDNISEKRAREASAYHAAAHRISERFAAGQPILVGHHSERKARKDKERMDSAMQKSVSAYKAINYWRYRAEGVERHASMKADPGVRARRIKTLLAELRDCQRDINHANKCLKLWTKIAGVADQEKRAELTRYYAGAHNVAPCSLYSALEKGDVNVEQAIEKCLAHHEAVSENPVKFRWINHILNRLEYERSELGNVPRFEGELTPVILQAFAREQGVDKPAAEKSDKGYSLKSPVDLPVHIGDGDTLDLTADEWRNLMQSVGHTVEIKQRRKTTRENIPLIAPTQEEAEKLQRIWNADAARHKFGKSSEPRPMTQAEYSANSGATYSRFETITLDERARRIWNSTRVKNQKPVCRVRIGNGGDLYAADRVIVITDKAGKSLPFDLDGLLSEFQQAKEVTA
jgi:hypothetical protein